MLAVCVRSAKQVWLQGRVQDNCDRRASGSPACFKVCAWNNEWEMGILNC